MIFGACTTLPVDHLPDGRDLLLFEQQPVKGMYRYLGCFAGSGWDYRTAVDTDGVNRQAIVFGLVPAEVREQPPAVEQDNSPTRSTDELRTLALAAAEMQPGTGSDQSEAITSEARPFVLMFLHGRKAPASLAESQHRLGEPMVSHI